MMVHQAILTYYLKTRASPIFTFSIQHITELPTSIQYVTYCCRNRLLNVPLLTLLGGVNFSRFFYSVTQPSVNFYILEQIK